MWDKQAMSVPRSHGPLQLSQDVFWKDNSSNQKYKSPDASNLEIIGAKKKMKEFTKSWTRRRT